MKKLFLTSGLVLCMACPAFADPVVPGPTVIDGVTADGNYCTQPVLGTDTGPATLEAIWNANISGAITLDSNRYATSDAGSAASTATTAAALSPVYSKYGVGIYGSTADATAETNAITSLSTQPVMTGYSFAGFYTGKAGSGTQVIGSNGTYDSGAKNVITTAGATATWYAHWTANGYTITYNCGSAKTGSASTAGGTVPTTQNINMDADYSLASNTCTLSGYTFAGWNCYETNTPANNLSGTRSVQYTDYDETQSTIFDENASAQFTNAANITCVAKWTQNNIDLTWNTGGADNNAAVQSSATDCTYDDGITLPTEPTKTGYTFGGWEVQTPQNQGN